MPEPDGPAEDAAAQLAELRDFFRPRLAERVREIEAAWEALREAPNAPNARTALSTTPGAASTASPTRWGEPPAPSASPPSAMPPATSNGISSPPRP